MQTRLMATSGMILGHALAHSGHTHSKSACAMVYYTHGCRPEPKLICFLFRLLFYSAILENFPHYCPQYANYSPIILISNPHCIMKTVTYTKQCYDYHDVIL